MSDKMEHYIDTLWRSLPATTLQDIANKMTAKGRGTQFDAALVASILSFLRKPKNATKYGWTVPHVSRGPNRRNEKRYIRVPLAADGSYVMETGENHKFVRDGLAATIANVTTTTKNERTALLAVIEHTRSNTTRRHLRDVADDLDYVSRKAASLLAELRDAA